ncbi:MAG: hypothetical protein R2831_09050 [Chitinophagaceae bacterium]
MIRRISCAIHFGLKIHILLGFLILFESKVLLAQKDTLVVLHGVQLDEVMIREVQSGFDVQAFINKIRQDTTFYKAFKNLHLLPYTLYNDIDILNKKEETKASYNSIAYQVRKKSCRSMTFQHVKTKGDFFDKKGNYNYYTAKLYAHLFFPNGEVCNENNIVAKDKPYSGTEKYEEQLRILIFNPGQPIHGIPGIGDNVAIFEEPTKSKYTFRLRKEELNGIMCYVFTAFPKKEFKEHLVINELTTWFSEQDFSIIARNYSLSYKTWFYDFDVNMKVKLKKINSYLVPYEIRYQGNWHMILKQREKANFTAIFTDFEG